MSKRRITEEMIAMAKKLNMENGQITEMTDEEIQKIKEEVEKE